MAKPYEWLEKNMRGVSNSISSNVRETEKESERERKKGWVGMRESTFEQKETNELSVDPTEEKMHEQNTSEIIQNIGIAYSKREYITEQKLQISNTERE